MTTSDSSMRFRKRILGAFGLLAGLALAAAPAQADICGDPDDIAGDLLDAYFDEFGDFFPLDSGTCDAMAKVFAKACDSAVKDAVKCADRQLDSIPKAAKPYCKEFSKNPSDCDRAYKEDAEDAKDSVHADANDAKGECNEATDIFFDTCDLGF